MKKYLNWEIYMSVPLNEWKYSAKCNKLAFLKIKLLNILVIERFVFLMLNSHIKQVIDSTFNTFTILLPYAKALLFCKHSPCTKLQSI